MNDACGQATFGLARGRGSDSLSPLITPSIWNPPSRPLLDPQLTILLSLRIRAAGAEYLLAPFFNGRIDYVNLTGGIVEVQCRDLGGYYLNDFIPPSDNLYGTAEGTDLEEVIRAKLVDNGWLAEDLAVTAPTGYALFGPLPQEPMSVMEAIRADAQKIGWDLRHFPGDIAPLRLYNPGRDRPLDFAVDDFLGPNQYKEISELSWGDADVRNVWHGRWEDENGDVHGPVIVSDAASIARYGERFAQIYINRAEGIRSDAAMLNMLNAPSQTPRTP
jgi:hypothetical protein